MKKIIILLLATGLSIPVLAQLETPAPSPASTVKQKVGLTDITIEYSRPGVKGRTVFGGLEQWGKMWRTGANGSTDVEFSKDVKFNGETLKAGKYALYTVPNPDKWDIIFHANPDYWGTGGDQYDAEGEALRFSVPSKKGEFTETFTIDINNIRNNSADLVLKWADTKIVAPFEVGTKEQVSANIKKVMAGPSANDYFAAARFYKEEGMDFNQALTWINKATEMRLFSFLQHPTIFFDDLI